MDVLKTLSSPECVEDLELFLIHYGNFVKECRHEELARSYPQAGLLLNDEDGKPVGSMGLASVIVKGPGESRYMGLMVSHVWIEKESRRKGIFSNGMRELAKLRPDRTLVISTPRTEAMSSWCLKNEKPLPVE